MAQRKKRRLLATPQRQAGSGRSLLLWKPFTDWPETLFKPSCLIPKRAAAVEETLFRGYAIERLQEVTGSILSAAVISWLASTVMHLNSWGLAFLIYAGFHGVILTLLYVWRRNLYSNIIAHWVVDAAIYLF